MLAVGIFQRAMPTSTITAVAAASAWTRHPTWQLVRYSSSSQGTNDNKPSSSSESEPASCSSEPLPSSSSSSSPSPSSTPSSSSSFKIPSPTFFSDTKQTNPLSSLSSSLSRLAKTKQIEWKTQLTPIFSSLSNQYNQMSGYDLITSLKSQVTHLEHQLSCDRKDLSTAKSNYLSSVSTRSSSQRQINDLLSRKSTWSESDLGDYTTLLRSEHQHNRNEKQAEKQLEDSEKKVQDTFDMLMKTVLMRYHEEQIWSDRIRMISTYVSLAVVGLNAVLFLLAILIVEPYKRKKLAQTFETRLLLGEKQGREMIQSTITELNVKLDEIMQRLETIDPSISLSTESIPLQQQDEIITPTITTTETEKENSKDRTHTQQLVIVSTASVIAGGMVSMLLSLCWS